MGDNDDWEAMRQRARDAFTEKRVQKAFIRKVFTILMFQFFFTMAILVFVRVHEPTREFLIENILFISIGSLILMMVISCCLSCSTDMRRTTPQNYICLGVYTVLFALLVSISMLFVPSNLIFLGFAITVAVVFALTIFAFQTKIDFTACAGVILVSGMVLMGFIILTMFFPTPLMQNLLSCFVILIFCIYIIFDIQLMIGGNHANAISPEDYVFAALSLYSDILVLFLHIVILLASDNN